MDYTKLAREFIRKILSNETIDLSKIKDMEEKAGVFVTLYEYGELRACMGVPYPTFSEKEALVKACEYVINDPRFPPLTLEELDRVDIEVSILTQPKELDRSNLTDEQLFEKIKGHGVILSNPLGSALFLPQVWEELPDPKQFLKELSLKAGLDEYAWKEKETKILLFDAKIYKEQG